VKELPVTRVLPAILACLVSVPALAQTPSDSPARPTVVASGEAVVKRAPDRAWVQISVESRSKDPRQAQKLNAAAMSAVLQKLKSTGLPGEAIQTRAYDLHPEYDYADGRQTLRGYAARNSLEVRVDDLPRLGDVLDVAVSSGANAVGNIRFDLKDRDAAEREALRLAVEDARKRAEAAASGAGMRVERIVRLEEHRIVDTPPRPVMMAMRAREDAAAQPPIEAGELEIRAGVTLTAEIR
jgi:uncharacterized protein YggE